MGLNINGLRFLLQTRASGVIFGRTLTIGRQSVSVTDREIRALPAALRAPLDGLSVESLSYADTILQRLGASAVEALDVTAYEGATVLHDLNEPIPDAWRRRYDLIFDGGSLEHVFNVPQALQNYMALLDVGGHLVCTAPANNFAGHGFYQFSPELFFAVFEPANGFAMCEAVLYEETGRYRWYRLTPSADARRRLTFQNCVPAHLLIRARKQADVPAFATTPQQRAYADAWVSHVSILPSRRVRALNALPPRLRWLTLNSWNVWRRFRPDLFQRLP